MQRIKISPRLRIAPRRHAARTRLHPHGLAQRAFEHEALRIVQSLGPLVARFHIQPKAMRPQIIKRHPLGHPQRRPPQALSFARNHHALQFNRLVRIAATNQNQETHSLQRLPTLNHKMPHIREPNRSLMLRAFPRRDERQVQLVLLQRQHKGDVTGERGAEANAG